MRRKPRGASSKAIVDVRYLSQPVTPGEGSSGESFSLEVPPDGSSLEFRGQYEGENPRMAKDSQGRMDPPAKSQESR